MIKKYKSRFENIEIATATYVDNVIYSVVCNGSHAIIYRDNALAKILESDKNSCVSASGHPQDGDMFILATSKFSLKFSDGVLKAAFQTSSSIKAAEHLMPMVHSKEDMNDLAVMFVKFEKHTKNKVGVNEKVPKIEKEDDAKKGKEKPKKVSWIKSKLPTRKLYVRKRSDNIEDVKSRKNAMSVGVILLILLTISIFFGIRQKNIKDLRNSYEDELSQAEHAFSESQKLVDLDNERARELFLESESIVKILLDKDIDDSRLNELSEKQISERGMILGEYLVESELFVDPSLFSDGFIGNKLSTNSKSVYILDSDSRRVVKIDLDTKKAVVVANPDDIKNAKDIASYVDRVFTLEDGDIYKVGEGREKVIEKEWEGDVLIYAYSGNFYVLDKEKSEILRYPGLSDGFGSSKNWFAPGITTDVGNSISWAVDGSIWLLDTNGVVKKYTQGLPDRIGEAIYKEAKIIYTDEDSVYVYILDPISKKIIVIDKDGGYIAQYVDNNLEGSLGVSVDEQQKRLIFLNSDGKLYSFELMHI